jgi:hypothetical protein
MILIVCSSPGNLSARAARGTQPLDREQKQKRLAPGSGPPTFSVRQAATNTVFHTGRSQSGRQKQDRENR